MPLTFPQVLSPDQADPQIDVNKEGRCSLNVTAIVRITLKDGCFHEDVGCGQGENIRGKGAALDKVSS